MFVSFPNTLIAYGASECFATHIEQMAKRMEGDGISVKIIAPEGAVHGSMLFYPMNAKSSEPQLEQFAKRLVELPGGKKAI